MVGLLVIFKTERLLNINFFIDVAIEKCTLDIYLIELDVMGTSKASKILIASNLATGAYVSLKSRPSTWVYPCATNLALFLTTILS